MQLEQQLVRAERNIEITKWVVVVALLLSVAGMFVAGSRVFGPADPWEQNATILSVSIGALHIIAVIVFWLGLASYVSRFAPRARKLRENLQNESIRELHREVAELRQMLAKREP
jgi:Ni,Fe-hydrogenase I cytochrome b subunit